MRAYISRPLTSGIARSRIAQTGPSHGPAAILAIFHFGHEDLYPEGDGSLKRAEKLLGIKHLVSGYKIQPELASPYRSYLALYLWRALGEGNLSLPEAS